MMSIVSIPIYQTIYRLGSLYASYRLIIALSLTLIFKLTMDVSIEDYQYPTLYFYTLIVFTFCSLLQLIFLKYLPHAIGKQFLALFAVDLIFLSSLTFALGGPNIAIGLLFVISVFISNFLLSKNQALFITLVAVICVIYQQFVGSLFTDTSLNNISNCALLAFLFFVVYAIGQFSIQRFRLMESLNTLQANELFQLQNINRYILEQIEIGYLVLDDEFKIIVSNPAACKLLGISPLYVNEKFNLAKVHPDLYEILNHSISLDGERFKFESQQSSYLMDVRIQKLIVPHQALTLLILEDSQKLNQKVQKLKLAALGQLTASIAHEIRNPLAAIVQANELNQNLDSEQVLLNQIISKQALRIDKIIKDTLGMVNNKKTKTSRIDLNTFFNDLVHNDLHDVKHQIKIQIEQKIYIYFDESQLSQVLINLIRNAIRHNSTQADFISIDIFNDGHHSFIDVIDYGKGIDKHNLSQIFQPFFSTEINGTGLGLYLSEIFCEANEATLNYIEHKHAGACFRIACQRIA